jgi:hypothetical protein
MSLTSPDFESGAYTNFATPALGKRIISRVVRESQPERRLQVKLTLTNSVTIFDPTNGCCYFRFHKRESKNPF